MNNENSASYCKKFDVFGTKENMVCSFDSSLGEFYTQKMKTKSSFEDLDDINIISNVEKKYNFASESGSSDEEIDNSKSFKKFVDLKKVCFLNHQKQSKQKIILNISKIKDDKYSDYFDALIESGTNLLKIPFTIYDEKNFEELKYSCTKLKEHMKIKNLNIPVMISFEYKIMRLENFQTVNFKKEEIVNFGFEPNLKQTDKEMYIISNYEYMKANKITPGDKILIDFGAGIFYISKIIYKNGRILKLDNKEDNLIKEKSFRNIITYSSDIIKESNFDLNYRELQIEENIDNNLFNSEKKFLDFIDKLYSGKKFEFVNSFKEDEEIEYFEAINQFDCVINPNRPVQILKTLKYDKYDYVPENFFTFGEKVIKEIDFEYLVLDYVNPLILQFFSNTLKKYKKTIPIVTKVFEFETLRYIDLISKYSSGVIISFNNLVKDLPFLDIVVMTNMLIKIFKKRGLAVYVHLQFFETYKSKMKPLPSAITDLLIFLQNGVDGFNLGSETFFNLTLNYNSIISLREYIIELMNLLPAALKLKLINKSEEEKKEDSLAEINSMALYNCLTNNEKIIIILISDDEKFLQSFLSYNVYNHIVLVTNKLNILKKFLLFSVSHVILVKEITSTDEEKMEHLERDIVELVKEDSVVKHLLKIHESSLLYIKCLKGHNFEVFDLF